MGVKIVDYRKIIKFGNSSHVVSLPKTWLEKNNLKKGDSLFFEEHPEGLMLKANSGEEINSPKEILIKTDGKGSDNVTREVFAAYINGNNIINIQGKNLKSFTKDIREQLNNLAGMEIIEQTTNGIVAKDFLRIEDVLLMEIVKKMDITTRSILKEAIDCVGKDTVENINLKDMDINRLYFLVWRTIRSASKNSSMAKTLGLKQSELISQWKLADSVENIADEGKRCARFFIILNENKAKELPKIKKLYKEIQTSFEKIMNSFYDDDKKTAHEISSRKKELISELEDLSSRSDNVVVGKLIEKMKSMATNVKTIARLIYY